MRNGLASDGLHQLVHGSRYDQRLDCIVALPYVRDVGFFRRLLQIPSKFSARFANKPCCDTGIVILDYTRHSQLTVPEGTCSLFTSGL